MTGLAFSPDCKRFYDLRGSSVNAWEPNSLVRFAETEETFSDTASEDHSSILISQASEACVEQYEAISSLQIAPSCDSYCIGNEEGVVDLIHAKTGENTELARLPNFLSITHIAWSSDAKCVAAADLSGEIVLKRLTPQGHTDTNGKIGVSSMPSPKIDLEGRGIHQMLFSRDSRLLLIITEDRGLIIDATDANMKASTKFDNARSRQWLLHPTQDHLLLAFGTDDLQILRLNDFPVQYRLVYHEGRPRFDSHTSFYPGDERTFSRTHLTAIQGGACQTTSSPNKAMVTQDGKHVLVEIHGSSGGRGSSNRLLVFDNSTFEPNAEGYFATTLKYLFIPPSIIANVETALGILGGSRLVFLDQDSWVCTFKIGSKYYKEAPKRQYFIPRDWVTTEAMELCSMTRDGTLLCPKHDQVAVIRSSLNSDDF